MGGGDLRLFFSTCSTKTGTFVNLHLIAAAVKFFSLLLFFSCLISVVSAAEKHTQRSALKRPDDPSSRASVINRPGYESILAALEASGYSRIFVEATLTHDSSGNVLSAYVKSASGVDAIDLAIIAWCKAAKVTPGKAGQITLPFEIELEDAPEEMEKLVIDLDGISGSGSMMFLKREFVLSGMRELDVSCVINRDASGRVGQVGFERNVMPESFRRSVWFWCTTIRFEPGLARTERLRFKIVSGSGEDSRDIIHVASAIEPEVLDLIKYLNLVGFWLNIESQIFVARADLAFPKDHDFSFRVWLDHDENGRVTRVKILKGSGFKQMDDAASEMLTGSVLHLPIKKAGHLVLDLSRHGSVRIVTDE